MAMEDSFESTSKEVEKLVKQLTAANKELVKLNEEAAKTAKNMGGGGSANSITSTGSDAHFSSETTSSMPGSSWKSKAAGVASVALGVAEFAYNVTPGLTDALNHQNSLFSSAFAGNSYNNDKTFGKIRAAFSGAFDSATGPNEAAALATGRGISQNSASFGRVMGEAGFMSKMTGMSNVAAASGSVGMSAGVGGAAGKLAQVGIFTNSLSTGNYKGLGDIIDQMWARVYGSKSAKVPLVKFDADILGGFLGQDLAVLFGDQPELLNMVKEGMRLKAKAGGMAGINFDNAAKGPKSANAIATKMGMTPANTPYLTSMKANEARAGAISTASDSLIKGFEKATDFLVAFNGKLEELGKDNGALGQLYDASMQVKGAFETMAGDTGGSAMLGAAFGLLGGIVARFGGMTSAVTGGMSGAMGALGGSAAALGKIVAGLAVVVGGVLATNWGVDKLRENDALQKGSLPDRFATAAATAGGYALAGAAGGFLIGGPIGAAIGAVGGTVVGAVVGWNKSGDPANNPQTQPAGAGATDALSRSAQGAVEWAGQSTTGKQKWPGWCDGFVANVYGQEHSNYANAKTHWTSTPDRLRHSKDTNAPLGSLVYWNNGKDGHVAVVTGTDGDGNPLITTTHTNGGTPTVMPLSQAMQDLGGKGTYSGWAVPYFQGKTAALDGVTASAAPTASATAVPGALGGSGPGDVEYAMKNMHKMRSIDMTGVSNPIMAAMQKSTQPSTVYGGVDEAQAARDEEYSATNRSGLMSTPRDDASTSAAPSAGVPRGKSKLLDTLMAAGFKGENLREAWAVAMRESGGRADAHNPDRSTGDNSYGMFQINMLGQMGKDRDKKFKQYVDGYTGPDSLFDPLVNARAAAYMTQKGKNWYHWDIDASGYDGGSHSKKYQKFYAQYPGASAGMMVANDQLVNVHQGETIMSAETSHDFRTAMREVLSGGRGRGGDVNITLHIDKASDEEATRFANKVMELMKSDSRTERLRMR